MTNSSVVMSRWTFANTVYRRTPELGADLLDSATTLAAWLHHAKLLPARNVSVGSDGFMTPLTPQGALTVLALHGIRLALSPLPRPVRACDRCGWFFIDTSRGRRRR